MDFQNFTLCPEERERLFLSRTGLDDSVLSSVCGTSTIEDSMKKIQELKMLDEQTDQEEAILHQKNKDLQNKLKRLESQLDTLINTFVRAPVKQASPSFSTAKTYKIMKPGSVSSKFYNEYSCINFSSSHSSKTNIEIQEQEESIRKEFQSKQAENGKDEISRYSRTTENSPFNSPRLPTSPYQYRQSLQNNQNYIKMLWQNQNKSKRISENEMQKNLKSYLSPRTNKSYLGVSNSVNRFRKEKRI